MPSTPVTFLQSPQRIWLDLTVGTVLVSMLVFGSVYIFRLNNDARQVQFSDELAMRGQQVSTDYGCIACHTVDGSPGVGPTWLGMWGSTETLSDGRTVVVDQDYFVDSVLNPGRDVVAGYPNVMMRSFVTEDEVIALLAFARSLAADTAGANADSQTPQ
jgi:mono/diheme cytochrome c family protein